MRGSKLIVGVVTLIAVLAFAVFPIIGDVAFAKNGSGPGSSAGGGNNGGGNGGSNGGGNGGGNGGNGGGNGGGNNGGGNGGHGGGDGGHGGGDGGHGGGDGGHGGGGNNGGGDGGHGGGGEGGGNNGGGNTGGGNTGGGSTGGGASSPSVSAPSVSVSGNAGGYNDPVVAYGNGKDRIKIITDLMACTAGGTINTTVQYDTRADGKGNVKWWVWSADSSYYGALQCMKDLGYKLNTAARGDLTNFGQR